ncbi:DUF5324 family protein [Streptomyces sp. TRM 70361]|uniref:DUF5324 family protein n=1 Tax=Streptomyces sp. TRM 70361 TaxID=3116553 RepID=UPI003FCD0C09
MKSVRSATDNARDSVRHAAEVVAPKVALAADQARSTVRGQYVSHVAPRLGQVRETIPPAVDTAAVRAAQRTREAARTANEFAGPRVEAARAAAGPVREAALARSAAAVAALRGELTADDIRRLARRKARRARTGRAVKGMLVFGLLAGGATAVWKWWERQSNPDWLVEPPDATEVGNGATVSETATNGSSPASAKAGTETGETGETDTQGVSSEAAPRSESRSDEER